MLATHLQWIMNTLAFTIIKFTKEVILLNVWIHVGLAVEVEMISPKLLNFHLTNPAFKWISTLRSNLMFLQVSTKIKKYDSILQDLMTIFVQSAETRFNGDQKLFALHWSPNINKTKILGHTCDWEAPKVSTSNVSVRKVSAP